MNKIDPNVRCTFFGGRGSKALIKFIKPLRFNKLYFQHQRI